MYKNCVKYRISYLYDYRLHLPPPDLPRTSGAPRLGPGVELPAGARAALAAHGGQVSAEPRQPRRVWCQGNITILLYLLPLLTHYILQ